MDRAIPTRTRRLRALRKGALALPGLLLVVGGLAWLPGLLTPTIARSRLRTAPVDRGRIEAVVEASGTVVPAFDRALPSPVDARVLRILKRPGDPVEAGEPILELDTSAARLEVGRLDDRLAGKRNEEHLLRLSLDRELADLEARLEAGRLDREVLRARLARHRRLSGDGLVSAEALAEAEVQARKADIDLAHLEASRDAARRQTQARLDGVALEVATLAKEAGEARRQLELATARADATGVVTWVPPQEGAAVGRGDVMARVARLDAFRVEATAAAVHAAAVRPGLPVEVVLADRHALRGRVASVYPAIESGAVQFEVALDDPADPALRASLRVDVRVVTAARDGVLRLPRGAWTQVGARQRVFVVGEDRARARTVRLGLAGAEAVEVLDGVGEGEIVVVSDMRDFEHAETVGLR